MSRDPATGRFIQGESGNPGGRPKGFVKSIRELTNEGTDMVEFWVKVFNGEKIGEYTPTFDDRKEAAKELANRGFSKPPVLNYDVDTDELGKFSFDSLIDEINK